jgi:hypothetical protein
VKEELKKDDMEQGDEVGIEEGEEKESGITNNGDKEE